MKALREELSQEKNAVEAQMEAKIKELEAQLEHLTTGPAPAVLAEEYQNVRNVV